MNGWDKEYLELCKKILKDGVEVENRTGINTIKVPSHSFHFDLSKEFPILQTKQLFSRQAITEMLWIWQIGSNDVRELHKRDVHIWDEWMVDKDGIYRIYEPKGEYNPDKEVIVIDPLSVPVSDPFGENHEFKPKLDKEGNVMTAKSLIPGKTIKAAKWYGKKYANTIGTAYGFIVNRYNHTRNLISNIINNPNDRRKVKSLWQDEFLRTAVLPSCVWSTEWDVTEGKLNLLVHQRSCDVPLGLPFNVTQYATLLSLIAQVTNLEPGSLDWSIKDAHIYINQINGIKTQIERGKTLDKISAMNKDDLLKLKKELEEEQFIKGVDESNESKLRAIDLTVNPEKPYLWINKDIDNFFDFDNSKELKDIKVKQYKHMGKISFPISQ